MVWCRTHRRKQKQFYISEGFAHGFLVLSDEAEFCYKVTDFYHPGDEGGLAWNDPSIGIEWPQLVGEYPETQIHPDISLKMEHHLTLAKKILSGILLRIHLNSNNYH